MSANPSVYRCIARGKATKSERFWNAGNHDFYLQYEKDKPTKFDELVSLIGLSGKPIEYLIDSKALRNFAKKNRRYCYVPEVLLKAWNLATDEREVG